MENQANNGTPPKKEILSVSLEEELDKIRGRFFSPQKRKKKLIMWVFRLVLVLSLYFAFRDQSWAQWMLWVYIPVSVLSLTFILGGNYFLNRKIEKIRQKIRDSKTDTPPENPKA